MVENVGKIGNFARPIGEIRRDKGVRYTPEADCLFRGGEGKNDEGWAFHRSLDNGGGEDVWGEESYGGRDSCSSGLCF